MSRPVWFVSLLRTLFPTRFLLARATRVPGLGQLLEHPLFAGDELMIVPHRKTITVNASLAPPEQLVLPSRLVAHFIDRTDVHWIMNDCLCRRASDCQNHPPELGCLFLGPAADDINPALGRRVTREEAHAHVARCREAGLVHLIGRNKLDTVWLGVGPGTRLLTICSCCPCCCLWRMLPHVSGSIADKVTRLPGVHVSVTEHCTGCGDCLEACFVEAISLSGTRAAISPDCRGCGRCVAACPADAIELTLATDRFVEEAIARIEPLVKL